MISAKLIIAVVIIFIILITISYLMNSKPQPAVQQPISQPVIPIVPVANSAVKYFGCYADTQNRALPTLVNTSHSVSQCAAAAKAVGAKYFGMQYGDPQTGLGQCWVGNDPTRFGKSTACSGITDPATMKAYPGAQMGGAWANAVYGVY